MGAGDSLSLLLRQAKQGQAAAQEALLARYRPYLRVVCALRLPQLCQKREDASDIVQLAMIDAAGALPDFRGGSEGEFEAWILQVLERNILQSLRRHTSAKRDVRREAGDGATSDAGQFIWHSIGDNGSTPTFSVIRGEAALRLAAALEQLPADQKLAVELRYLGQYQLKQIAEYMDKSTGAVAGLIRRGVDALRQLLPPELAEVTRWQ
jgi:RNA polymerase sigma-70 factor (ECF subfamily)